MRQCVICQFVSVVLDSFFSLIIVFDCYAVFYFICNLLCVIIIFVYTGQCAPQQQHRRQYFIFTHVTHRQPERQSRQNALNHGKPMGQQTPVGQPFYFLIFFIFHNIYNNKNICIYNKKMISSPHAKQP